MGESSSGEKTDEVPVCKYCNSRNITVSAEAQWDVETKDWVITNIYDNFTCSDCGDTFKFANWEPK